MVLLGEHLAGRQWIGCAITLSAVTAVALIQSRPNLTEDGRSRSQTRRRGLTIGVGSASIRSAESARALAPALSLAKFCPRARIEKVIGNIVGKVAGNPI